MNILFCIDRYPGIGGIEFVSTEIIKELRKYHNIYVVSNMQQEGIECPEFVNLLKMPDCNNELSSDNLTYLISAITEKRIDAVVYQDSYGSTNINVCKAVELTDVPLYVFEHNSPLFVFNKRNLDPITTQKGFLRHVFHPYILYKEIKRKRYLLEHSKKYVLLSKQFIPEFCNLIGADVDDNRITYINNPAIVVDEDTHIKKENIILCVSRLAQEKCVDKMIRMWSNIADKLKDWRFVIVGDGHERRELEKMVISDNIPRVEFVGFAKPTEYYQKAKIFWMTSKFEGWGMTLIEAMQQGCVPIVFQTFSSVKDIIEDGVCGYLIQPDNYFSFECKTKLLTHNDTLWNALSENGKKKTLQFSMSKVILDWNKLLKSN